MSSTRDTSSTENNPNPSHSHLQADSPPSYQSLAQSSNDRSCQLQLAPSEPPPPYSEADLLLPPPQDRNIASTRRRTSQVPGVPARQMAIDDRVDVLKSAEFVYEKLITVLVDKEKLSRCEACCCLSCCCVGMNEDDTPANIAHAIGYRAILHIMFTSNPSKVCMALVLLLLLTHCCTSLGLFILNCIVLSLNDHNGQVESMIIAMTTLSFILFIYTLVDFIMHTRYTVKTVRHDRDTASQLAIMKTSYVQNVIRHILPEVILYPLFTLSMSSILTLTPCDEPNAEPPLIGYTNFSETSTGLLLMNVSMLTSGCLLAIMVYMLRLIFFVQSIYLVFKAQFNGTGGSSNASKKRSLGICFFLLFHALLLSTYQILLLCNGFGNFLDSDTSSVYYLSYGYVSYTIGMSMICFINFGCLRGICVEFVHNVCKKIIATNPQLQTRDLATFQFLTMVESSVSTTGGYSSFRDSIIRPFKSIWISFLCCFISFIHFFLITFLALDADDFMLYDGLVYSRLRRNLCFVIIAFICFANFQTLLIGIITTLIIPLLITILPCLCCFLLCCDS